jgi:hypothetical protein
MKHDLRNYVPDVAKVLEESHPEAIEKRQRKAREKLREAGLLDRATPAPAARASAPSPWAKDGARPSFDQEALPSALVPAAPAEDRPVTKAAAPAVKRWPATWILVLGSIGFMLAVALTGVLVLMGRATVAAEKAAAVPPSAAATADPVPIPKGTMDATGAPSAAAAPSTTATASVSTVPSSTAPPTASPTPSAAPPPRHGRAAPNAAATARPQGKPSGTTDAPHGDPTPAPPIPTPPKSPGTQDPGLNE